MSSNNNNQTILWYGAGKLASVTESTILGSLAWVNLTWNYNTLVWLYAWYWATTMTRSVHIWYQAWYASNGSYNIHIGSFTGYANTSTYNVMIGENAWQKTNGGAWANMFIGSQAWYWNLTGSQHAYI